MNSQEKETQNSKNKLNAISVALRLGHDAFKKEDLSAAALHILNNTNVIVKYDRACLVDMRKGKTHIIAVSGQSDAKRSSEYCLNMKKLLSSLRDFKKQVLLDKEMLAKNNASPAALTAFDYFTGLNDNIILIPLLKPDTGQDAEDDGAIFWVLEFFSEIDKKSLGLLSLLTQHYREAIWYFLKSNKGIFPGLLKYKKYFTPLRTLICLLFIFIIVSFFRVSQNVSANFELFPTEQAIEYAPYSGIISTADYKNGAKVKKNDVILRYDTEEQSYKLADAENSYNEIAAELDWVKQKSFLDKKELGRVKLLAMKLQKEKILIEKMNWYLKKANVKAKNSGTLVLKDSEKWTGKAVNAGDLLFEIVSPDKLYAEVMLDETNASVLSKKTKVTLYLHSSPETPIYGRIISVSPKPMLTKTGQFCYIIKFELNKIKPNYIVGMRGTARVRGEKVSIAYYLLRSIVLWWRKL